VRNLGKPDSQRRLAGERAFARWLNQCVACERIGFKPELPARTTARLRLGSDFADFPTGVGPILRRSFEALALDARGLCDACAALLPEPDR
jgi:hypothetical protein